MDRVRSSNIYYPKNLLLYRYLYTIILSISFPICFRANLSHDYFTNRQDRYIVAKNCGQLADFYEGLINILCDMSLQLNSSNSVSFPECDYHPFRGSTKVYINELHRRISTYYSSFIDVNKKSEGNDLFFLHYTVRFGFVKDMKACVRCQKQVWKNENLNVFKHKWKKPLFIISLGLHLMK